MTCKYTSKDIGRYLLDQMTPEEETEFQFHLSECGKCPAELQAIRNLAETLKNEETGMTQPAGKKTLPLKRNIHLHRYLIAASVILLCGLGIAFYGQPDKPVTKKALTPDIYLYQDSVSYSGDSIPPTTKKDTL